MFIDPAILSRIAGLFQGICFCLIMDDIAMHIYLKIETNTIEYLSFLVVFFLGIFLNLIPLNNLKYDYDENDYFVDKTRIIISVIIFIQTLFIIISIRTSVSIYQNLGKEEYIYSRKNTEYNKILWSYINIPLNCMLQFISSLLYFISRIISPEILKFNKQLE